MRSIAGVIFGVMALLSSCKAGNDTQESEQALEIAIADTVSGLGNSIWYVFQAVNGDYWFGSDTSGVYRYDGKTILNYTTKQGLAGNRIRGIQEDKHGNLFFTTLSGISKFNGKAFTTLEKSENTESARQWKLQPEDLWFGILGKDGEKGPYRYDGEQLYSLEFPKHEREDDYYRRFPNVSWSPYEIYSIYKDHRGVIWFGTGNFGICRYDGKSLRWMYEDQLTYTPEGGSFGIRSILEDVAGKFWICNSRYRYTFSSDNDKEDSLAVLHYKKENGIDGIRMADGRDHIYFLSITQTDNGDLWMATYRDGAWRYDGKTATQYQVLDGTEEITLFSVYKDRRGDIWLGTQGHGVYKFNGVGFERFLR